MPLTKEQIDEALQSDAAKQAIQASVEKQLEALKNKNDELLGKLRGEKDKRSDLEKRLDAIEADKIKAQETAAAKTGDIEKLRETLEGKYSKQLEALTAEKERLNKQLNSHVLGEGLTQSLVKSKVSPHLMDAAKALINTSHKAEVIEVDGKIQARIDGVPVSDFVTSWSQSDTGKHFVVADGNSGGGSNGANGRGDAAAGKTVKRDAFEQMTASQRAETFKSGATIID